MVHACSASCLEPLQAISSALCRQVVCALCNVRAISLRNLFQHLDSERPGSWSAMRACGGRCHSDRASTARGTSAIDPPRQRDGRGPRSLVCSRALGDDVWAIFGTPRCDGVIPQSMPFDSFGRLVHSLLDMWCEDALHVDSASVGNVVGRFRSRLQGFRSARTRLVARELYGAARQGACLVLHRGGLDIHTAAESVDAAWWARFMEEVPAAGFACGGDVVGAAFADQRTLTYHLALKCTTIAEADLGIRTGGFCDITSGLLHETTRHQAVDYLAMRRIPPLATDGRSSESSAAGLRSCTPLVSRVSCNAGCPAVRHIPPAGC